MKATFSILLILGLPLLAAAQQSNDTPAAQPTNQLPAAQQTNQVAGASTNLAAPPPGAPAQLGSAELEKLAMPIALHPDPLIAIILPASAYPVEVVQAARFVKDTNNVAKVDEQSWDENVKAVAKFPDVISMMDSNLTWTVQLGQTFVNQPKELMDAIQSLRLKAKDAGTLQSSPQQVVTVTNEVVMQTNVTQVVAVTNQIVQVQPSNPEVIYVPSYPPSVYYPPPGYVYDPVAPLVTFGVGMAMGAVIANNCDWHGGGVYVGPHGAAFWGGGYHGDVDVDVDRNVNVNQNINRSATANRNVNRTTTGNQAANAGGGQQKWQPNQSRMQTSGAGAATQTREARGWGGGSAQPTAQQTGAGSPAGARTSARGSRPSQPAAGANVNRPTQPSAGAGAGAGVNRPAQAPSASGGTRPTPPSASGAGAGGQRPAGSAPAQRPSAPQQPAASRPTPSPPASRPAASQSAFSGVSSGGGAANYSSRGAASRGGGGGGRGGRR